jgi:hypothetical protein
MINPDEKKAGLQMSLTVADSRHQAALHGVLVHVEALGLELLELRRITTHERTTL